MNLAARLMRVLKTDLVKVSSWSALATAVKLGTSLLLSKVLAVLVGPAGVALIGQLMNGIAIFLNLSTGAINAGVTKYTAEYGQDESSRRQLYNTTLVITLVCSLVVGLLVVLFRQPLSHYLLGSSNYSYVLLVLGATLWLYALNINLLAIANGLQHYRIYIAANIAGSLSGLVLSFVLARQYGLPGALIAAAVFQSLVVFITAGLILWQQRSLYFTAFRFSRRMGGLLLRFSAMSLVSAIVMPWSLIAIRNSITASTGIANAGIWESMNRISFAWLSLFTLSLQTYFLPRLSAITDRQLLRRETVRAYKLVMPVVLLCALCIFLFRDTIIVLLFTGEFSAMRSLFAWQLAGDVVKIAGWLLAILFWARGMMKWFIITEIFFSLLYVVLAKICVNAFGLQGACIAFLISCTVYLAAVYLIIRKEKVL